jgi:hypothetical protein
MKGTSGRSVAALMLVASLAPGACAAPAPALVPPINPSLVAPTPPADDPPASEVPPAAEVSFVRWSDPNGFISTEVPAGWTVEGGLGEAGLTDGQFTISARSGDGRTQIFFAHNLIVFMEAYYGSYMPGSETIERLLLPDFVRREGVKDLRVTFRSANTHVDWPSAGGSIPLDTGTLGFLYVDSASRVQYGAAIVQTLYIASVGTPGAWRPRLYAAAVAPADDASQAVARVAIERLVARLELSDQFIALWNEGFSQTQQVVRAYSDQMTRIFRSSSSAAGTSGDAMDDWASYMRGGEYATNPETGDSYWVTNDTTYHYVNSQGTIVGNDTGTVPAGGGNWTQLTVP